MKYENIGQMNFFLEMSRLQVTSNEFFTSILMNSLNKNFELDNLIIFYFDINGEFLSWTNKDGMFLNKENHPYRKIIDKDEIRNKIYKDSVKDNLTYFNVSPRIYKSSDIINCNNSPYIEFIESEFNAKYSLSMAFGINGYIQVTFLKSVDEGDFSESEVEILSEIYVYIANFYKNFKKYEHSNIVSSIKSQIISSGEKAYLIIDEFMHIMNYNEEVKKYLDDILGFSVILNNESPCNWLYLLLGNELECGSIKIHSVKNYVFKIHTHNQCYSNGIIDKYYWITVSKKEKEIKSYLDTINTLTKTEKKVANLIYEGYTYNEIAKKLVISYHTVKKHIQNIYIKCGVNSRFQLCKWFESMEKED